MNFTRLSFDALGSTNTEAVRHARAGAEEGLVVTARQQRAGRGRQGRVWQTPVGNLAASFVLRPSVPLDRIGQLAFVAALAVGETIAHFGIEGWELKWPNDVQVAGAKIAGILLERDDDWVVMGIGINVASAPNVQDRTTTALASHTPIPVSADATLFTLQANLSRWYTVWLSSGFEPVLKAWRAHAIGMGRDVRIRRADGSMISGCTENIGDSGALVLRLNDGTTIHITSGDVFYD